MPEEDDPFAYRYEGQETGVIDPNRRVTQSVLGIVCQMYPTR